MSELWEFFRATTPDLQERLGLRWYWRHSEPAYVATSLAGFDDLEACVENAREHGMTDGPINVHDGGGSA